MPAPVRPRPRAPWRDDPTWVLLVLRAFLGFAFLYAGLSKIGDRTFLDSSSPLSMHANVLAVKASSPIGGLLGPVADHSFAFGLLMASGETAVGIGVLLGLLTRVAVLGGMVLSLSLFLTVSWNATPWFTGADIVYLFAFTPLLLAGRTAYSLDDWLAAARLRHGGVSEDRTRRALLVGSAGIAGLVAVGIASLTRGSAPARSATGTSPATGSSSGAGTAPASGSASATATAGTGTAGGQELIAATKVPVGGASQTTDPSSGDPVWVLQLSAGAFTALDAICPHQGCTVDFVSASEGFLCPCHRSAFDATGKVINGPATSNLKPVAVVEAGGEVRLS